MTDIKICGLTREEDVATACALGAAILGFNFVASSSRCISPSRARFLGEAAAPGVLRAGVFAESDSDEVTRTVREARLDVVQLHRAVVPADFGEAEGGVVAAVRVERGREGLPPPGLLGRCRAILWDSSGGRGRTIDSRLVEEVVLAGSLPVPVFVAGGLDADNVGDVIRRLRPAGVDVATGVESVPGVKDRRKLERFFEAVHEADRG